MAANESTINNKKDEFIRSLIFNQDVPQVIREKALELMINKKQEKRIK